MDIFRFTPIGEPTRLVQGEIINGLNSKMWVERYDSAGEFKFVSNNDVSIVKNLPVGSLISHTDTLEVMIVENHEINQDRGKETQVTITGRGFETFLENRIVGSNKNFPTITGAVDYILENDLVWKQVLELINDHIDPFKVLNGGDVIPYLEVIADVTSWGEGETDDRSVKQGPLYSRALELLAIENLGLKLVRPGQWSPLGSSSQSMALVIHHGIDRSKEVIFTYDTGEIESADYFWSNRKRKNTALVSGRWVETLVTTMASGYNRRMMVVDARDVDNQFTNPPTGAALTKVINAMQQRGRQELAAQKDVSITKAEVSKDIVKSIFRKDFNVGDKVLVRGDYAQTEIMRVSEYIEIEDEHGESGYPTLTVD